MHRWQLDCREVGVPEFSPVFENSLENLMFTIIAQIFLLYTVEWLPRWLSSKELSCQRRSLEFDLWVGKIPWKRKWQPTPVFLLEKFHGQKSLVGYSPWGRKESDMTEAYMHACMFLLYHNFPTYELVLFKEHICKSNLFVSPTKLA